MCGCLIICRSLTSAQRAKRQLERRGITATIVRPPIEVINNSCGYAVKVNERYLADSLVILKDTGLNPIKVVTIFEDGDFKEVET